MINIGVANNNIGIAKDNNGIAITNNGNVNCNNGFVDINNAVVARNNGIVKSITGNVICNKIKNVKLDLYYSISYFYFCYQYSLTQIPMATQKMRVPIPRNPEELIRLGSSVFKKHVQDADASPLKSMKDYNWETEGPKLDKALAKHNEAEELKKKMEAAYKERDLLLANTVPIIRASRDILAGINSQNMKRLGDWGFTVEASAVAARKK